jgi:acyl-CoA synthetase (AMP-forming)/AMP-acid ligase II
MYGATEAAARLAYLPPSEVDARVGSIGRAIPNVELRVLRDDGHVAAPGEIGELVARGSNIASGYWNAPEETAERFGPEGYRTGDLGFADEDGYLFLVGRRHDMLKIGAHRVGAKEVEDVLHEHPAVFEAAVIGVEHDVLGEAPAAFVSAREGWTARPEEIIEFCRQRLAEYKIPVRVTVLTELPKSPAGKVDKGPLRKLANHPVVAV